MSAGPWAWRKSTYSGDRRCCVEVAVDDTGSRWVRDSKSPGGTTLGPFTAGAWTAFLADIRAKTPTPVS